MTNEELLIPRFEVIGDYPNSPYKVGDTISFYNQSFHLTTTKYRDEFGESFESDNYYKNSEIEKYPNLFQKINWWERRDMKKDMPKYLKCIVEPKPFSIEEGKVYKASKYYIDLNRIALYSITQIIPLSFFVPSTEEEFNQQNKNTK